LNLTAIFPSLNAARNMSNEQKSVLFLPRLLTQRQWCGLKSIFYQPIQFGGATAFFRINIVWRSSLFKIDCRYHHMNAFSDSTDFGKEADIEFSYKPSKKHNLSLRIAQFHSASVPSEKNVRKVFLSYAYNL
jgi:hypothetical protein